MAQLEDLADLILDLQERITELEVFSELQLAPGVILRQSDTTASGFNPYGSEFDVRLADGRVVQALVLSGFAMSGDLDDSIRGSRVDSIPPVGAGVFVMRPFRSNLAIAIPARNPFARPLPDAQPNDSPTTVNSGGGVAAGVVVDAYEEGFAGSDSKNLRVVTASAYGVHSVLSIHMPTNKAFEDMPAPVMRVATSIANLPTVGFIRYTVPAAPTETGNVFGSSSTPIGNVQGILDRANRAQWTRDWGSPTGLDPFWTDCQATEVVTTPGYQQRRYLDTSGNLRLVTEGHDVGAPEISF